ncbi:MAG TPA: hypothetical protein VIG62_12845 [Blastocatellia bacterium]|jgi:hypothetical protein
MKRTLTTIVLLLAVAVAALAQTTPAPALPSVDEVLKKHVDAVGGKAALEKASSRLEKGSLDIPAMGASGTFEVYSKAPNKTLTVVTIDGAGVFLQGYDGKTGWDKDPFQGLRELSGTELATRRRASEFYGELKFKELYPKTAVTGKSKVGEREVYVVEATPAEGDPEKFYFDTQSGLMLRNDSVVDGPQGRMPTETYFEDYKAVDGIMRPHTLRQSNSAISFVIKLTEVKHNAAIEDAKFAKPAQ